MLLNNYWATPNYQVPIFLQPSKVLPYEGKLSGDNSDRNIVYLKRTNFHVHLFLQAKKIVFREYLFLQMVSFWKCQLYKLQPHRKQNEKRQLNQGILPNFSVKINEKTGRSQWEKLLLLIDSKKSWINQHFFVYFFWCICFREIWILCKFTVYLFSQMPFRRKFRVFNFAKSTKIGEIRENMYMQKLVCLRYL